MDRLDAESSEPSSGRPLLYAFSLAGADRAQTRVGRPSAASWRDACGNLWGQLTVADVFDCQERSLVASRAKRLLAAVERDLLSTWESAGANQRAVLRCAVIALECSARVWQAFGPVAGERRPHLLRRTEDALACSERRIAVAELSLRVNRGSVSRAARSACVAIDDLLAARADRADALAALEDASVELASLAIRVATSAARTRGDSRGSAGQRLALRLQLNALACEVSEATRAQHTNRDRGTETDHLWVWISAALSAAPSAEAIELVSPRSGGDPCLRADAFCSLRARWLELTVRLWMIARALDDVLVIGMFDDEDRLKMAVSSRASSALVHSAMCDGPDNFDHREAWERHRAALCELVSDVCRALQTREQDAAVRGQQLAVRRAALALAAIWTIDERARRATRGVGRPCR